MTEYEKMLHNLPYDYTDKEVQANILRGLLCYAEPQSMWRMGYGRTAPLHPRTHPRSASFGDHLSALVLS